MAQTMRHLAVLADFVPLKWHDLARHTGGGDCGHKIRASVRLSFDRRRQRMLYRTVCVRMRTVDAFWSRCLFVAHSFVAYKLQALLHVKPLPSLRFKPLIMYSSISINVSHYKCKPETLSRVIYGILLAA